MSGESADAAGSLAAGTAGGSGGKEAAVYIQRDSPTVLARAPVMAAAWNLCCNEAKLRAQRER